MEAAVFSLFPSLPKELRIQIWLDALPDKVGKALYFYKKGYWQPRYLTEADADYNRHNDKLNLVFGFHHELLDDLEFVLPSFFVNREARRITLSWIHGQGINIRFYKEKQCLTFTRSFNPKYDALYVALEKWDEFFLEPFDRIEEPDLCNRAFEILPPQITRIAVSQELLQRKLGRLAYLFEWYDNLDTLFIIIDTPPDLQPEDKDTGVQQRWELKSTQGATFSWDHDRDAFVGQCDDTSDQVLYELIQGASTGLGRRLASINKRNFEVQPGFAAQK